MLLDGDGWVGNVDTFRVKLALDDSLLIRFEMLSTEIYYGTRAIILKFGYTSSQVNEKINLDLKVFLRLVGEHCIMAYLFNLYVSILASWKQF